MLEWHSNVSWVHYRICLQQQLCLHGTSWPFQHSDVWFKEIRDLLFLRTSLQHCQEHLLAIQRTSQSLCSLQVKGSFGFFFWMILQLERNKGQCEDAFYISQQIMQIRIEVNHPMPFVRASQQVLSFHKYLLCLLVRKYLEFLQCWVNCWYLQLDLQLWFRCQWIRILSSLHFLQFLWALFSCLLWIQPFCSFSWCQSKRHCSQRFLLLILKDFVYHFLLLQQALHDLLAI